MCRSIVFLAMSLSLAFALLACGAGEPRTNGTSDSDEPAANTQGSEKSEKEAAFLSSVFFHVEGLMKTASGAT